MKTVARCHSFWSSLFGRHVELILHFSNRFWEVNVNLVGLSALLRSLLLLPSEISLGIVVLWIECGVFLRIGDIGHV